MKNNKPIIINTVMNQIKRGDIYEVELPTYDRDTPQGKFLLGKKRPCLIISDDTYNLDKNSNYWIAPITHMESPQNMADGLTVKLGISNAETSYIALNCIQSAPRSIIREYRGTITSEDMLTIDKVIVERGGLKNYIESVLKGKDAEIDMLKKELAGLQLQMKGIMEFKEAMTRTSKKISDQLAADHSKQIPATAVITNNLGNKSAPKSKSSATKKKGKHNYTGTKVADVSKWSAEQCRTFMQMYEDSEFTNADIKECYNIRSDGTYYKILKLCKEKLDKNSIKIPASIS